MQSFRKTNEQSLEIFKERLNKGRIDRREGGDYIGPLWINRGQKFELNSDNGSDCICSDTSQSEVNNQNK